MCFRSGLAGSYYYGEQLTEEEADSIRFYFNYDMIGSPKPKYWVQASKPADRVAITIRLHSRRTGKHPSVQAGSFPDTHAPL